eukprot:3499503-Rhodomonas_salina.7
MAVVLRIGCAKRGTEIASAAARTDLASGIACALRPYTLATRCPVLTYATQLPVLRTCCAVSSAGMCKSATRIAMRCAVLRTAGVIPGMNSYYVLQVIESDTGKYERPMLLRTLMTNAPMHSHPKLLPLSSYLYAPTIRMSYGPTHSQCGVRY